MSKNTNLSFLTDFITADIVNSRVGINNASPQTTFDVTGTGKFSGILTLGSTISNGTYAYTLPSATGTLALTSDIPSVTGYVPYTGATQAVNLGYNSLSASFLRIDGAGPTLGSYLGFKHSTNVTTGADGYTSIYTFGTNTIAFKSVSGATTRDFSFSMASITPGVPGGRTYTLPDADGTIALTSNIPANPVGGTGTSGTIPVFTGSTTIGNSIIQSNATQVNVVGNGSQLLFDSLGQSKSGGIYYTNDFELLINNSRGVGSSIYLGNVNMDFHTNVSGNPRLRITSGGNILVGTTTDNGARLQVSGTATLTAASGVSLTTNGVAGQFSTRINGNATAGSSYGLGIYAGTNSSDDSFRVHSYSGTQYFTVRGDGNVGIGTTSPSRRLVVVGGNGNQLELDNTGQTFTQQFWKINGVETGTIWASTSEFHMYTYGSQEINFSTNTAPRMRITSGGNVLIGTTTDNGSKLRVSGGSLQIDGGFQRMYTYVIVVNPSSTGTITISSPTGTNMQGSMQVMAGGYGNGLTGNVTGLWLVGGLLFFDNAGTSTITQIVNSVTNFGSMSFQRSGDQYTVSLANTASSGGSTKSFYVSVIINGS